VLSFNELRVFLAAAETENFSEAARRLGMTQPAVSQQVRSLEQRLATDLFDRSGRNVTLPAAGRTLIPLARDVMDRAVHLEESMASIEGEVVGLLKIGCSTAAGKYILPRLLAGLRAAHPRVDVVCNVTNRKTALDLLRSGEVQVAMTSLREPLRSIEYRPFLTDRIVLIAPPGHPWSRRGATITVAELLRERFIVREEAAGTTEAVRTALARHDVSLEELKVNMVLGNSEAIRMAVAEGIGVAFVSGMVAAEAVMAGTVSVVPVENLDITTTLFMARATDRPATRAQSAFWEYAFSPDNDEVRRRPARLPA
jgi:DNA-binding transcriptional LysR family regulator